MEIKKQFKFSGIFKKLHEEDSKPIEISNANVFCYTNGNIFLEVNAQVNQCIGKKLRFEKYEGDYIIEGKTIEGWEISAKLANKSYSYTVVKSKNINQQSRHKFKLIHLYVNYNLDFLEENGSQEVIYGLTNVEILYEFSAKIDNLDTEVFIKPIYPQQNQQNNNLWNAEIRLKNIQTSEQVSSDMYATWIRYLLSIASGRCVSLMYKIEGRKKDNFQIKTEYWSGSQLSNNIGGIVVIDPFNLPSFIEQSAKKLNWNTFNDKGLRLALYWYIDTFVSTKSEVNFLTLCTVLEILNKRHSNNSSKRLLPKEIYKQIRKEIIETISNFKDNIDNKDYLEQY